MDDDLLIIGCDSDDEIDSDCSETSSDQPSDQHSEGRSRSSAEVSGEGDTRSRKRKRQETQAEKVLSLGQELALTDSEPENEDLKQEETGKNKKGKIEETSVTEEPKEADISHAIYSLGNYCPRMLRGLPCTKARCSWVHYMVPSSAVSQLLRILANRYCRRL